MNDERRATSDRRRKPLSGRRDSDPRTEDPTLAYETRQELGRIRTVLQKLVDAVQTLIGTLRKP
jgi:hypothetical protein